MCLGHSYEAQCYHMITVLVTRAVEPVKMQITTAKKKMYPSTGKEILS